MKTTFRIDDVSEYMDWERFDRLAALFERHGVKPLLGVIPENRDPELLRLPRAPEGWARIRALRRAGWPTAQHGTHHLYTTDKPGLLGISRRSEFAGLPHSEQRGLILRGRRRLRELGLDSDIFMAPAHSYDDATLEALRQLGFRYVSDGYSLFSYTKRGLRFIPCQSSRPRGPIIGVMTVCLHPNTMDGGDFDALDTWLSRNPGRAYSYGDILGCAGLGPGGWLTEKAVLALRRVEKSRKGRNG